MQDQQVIDATLGVPVSIALGPVPASGYEWLLDPADGVTVVDAAGYPLTAAPGAAVEQALTVLPEQLGRLELHLRLVRPWEPDQPIRIVSVALEVSRP